MDFIDPCRGDHWKNRIVLSCLDPTAVRFEVAQISCEKMIECGVAFALRCFVPEVNI